MSALRRVVPGACEAGTDGPWRTDALIKLRAVESDGCIGGVRDFATRDQDLAIWQQRCRMSGASGVEAAGAGPHPVSGSYNSA